MARSLRIKYEGAIYHITSRGNEKRVIFKSDKDRNKFLKILKDSLKTYNVVLYSYVLMPNHFHFLLETPLANINEFIRQFNITYTYYYNKNYKRVGHLYQGRYRSILVQKENYLNILSRYIHLNPIRIKKFEDSSFIDKEKYLTEFKWSSLQGYINNNNRESFIDYKAVLSDYGGDSKRGRENYRQTLQSDIRSEIEMKKNIVAGCLLGDDDFVKKIQEKYLSKNHKEIPAIRKIYNYCLTEDVIKIVSQETGDNFEAIKKERGSKRQILMEMLYSYAGLKGREIGKILGLDYSTVSVGRKRLRNKIAKDNEGNLSNLVRRIRDKLSIIKI
jgi:putative transposase